MAGLDAAFEEQVRGIATRLAELGAGGRSKWFRGTPVPERLMDWAMARPAFKAELFRFVDVFPALDGDEDVLRHAAEYFEGTDVPKALDLGIDVAEHLPFGRTLTASVARRNIARMAGQFIVGQTPEEAVAGLHSLWRQGSAHTVDLLGEKTVVAAEADRYAARVVELMTTLAGAAAHWAPDDHLERDDLGTLPRVNVSIKPTALSTHVEPLSADEAIESAKLRIRPILRLALERDVHVHVDMEHADVKDLTLRLVRELLDDDEFDRVSLGVVIQAYLRDSRDDLAEVISWSAGRAVPLTVRLVKGAYWDTETVHAKAEGWPAPVYEHKVETDANYERCVRLLHDHHGEVRAAFASHNLRSLAYAVAYGQRLGIPDSGFELQMLHGMAEPVHAAARRLGFRHRVYAPVGELVPGMAYLVRRLLENTSNESFVRHRFAEGKALEPLLEAPVVDELPVLEPFPARAPTDEAAPAPYEPEPLSEWRRAAPRDRMRGAVAAASTATSIEVPTFIAGRHGRSSTAIQESLDPGANERVVARFAPATLADVDAAVAAAVEAAGAWAMTPVAERAAVLFRAAAWLRTRRAEIAALEVFEAGKPWDQADADVCEAVDFCEYYGREALRLDAGAAARVQSPPGEENRLRYRGKGVAAVIAPWNFPLAIPAGMTAAALVAGNPVILKPAEQTPATAWRLVEALVAGGAPAGTIQFLPGFGDVGAALVAHPSTAVVAFTGSRPVGLAILREAAEVRPGQHHIKRVVAELGGKNAVIVDADADPDQAVPGIVQSAFGFAGQKCSAASRAIVVGPTYDAVVERLARATREVLVGHPQRPGVLVGPLIDADAAERLAAAGETASREGRVVGHWDGDLPAGGWYARPTVVADVDPATSTLWRDELFGPLLCVVRADSFDHAIELANDSEYALTAGCYSRSPVNLRRAAEELRAGNVYLNRGTTGAVVGRQPFGGYGMSGVGSKAGGPDYLVQFCDPRVVTENTLRQGFVPEPEAGT